MGGKPAVLLEKAAEGELEVAISPSILDEVIRVLREKFGRSEEELTEDEACIRSITKLFAPAQTLSVIVEDPDDDRILECALASGSEWIVKGDKDLLRRGAYGGIGIVTVAQFLERGRDR